MIPHEVGSVSIPVLQMAKLKDKIKICPQLLSKLLANVELKPKSPYTRVQAPSVLATDCL